MGTEGEKSNRAHIDTGPCILEDVMRVASTCIHAGSGVASARTRPVNVPATAENLKDFGAQYKEKLNMIIFMIGQRCRVMIFPNSVKLRCLEDHRTAEERLEAVTEVMKLISENLVCDEDG